VSKFVAGYRGNFAGLEGKNKGKGEKKQNKTEDEKVNGGRISKTLDKSGRNY